MNGEKLLARVLVALTLGILLYLLVDGVAAQATPIRPDPEKLVRQPESTTFVPARAGWDRFPAATLVARNPLLDSVSPERINSDFRDTVLSVAIPELWVVATLAFGIFLMRALVYHNKKRLRLRDLQSNHSREEMAA